MFNKLHYHFMGIGGIGMSALAKILKGMGHQVSGCDVDKEQKTIKELQKIGCNITFQHNSDPCKDSSINVLVHSTAVKQTNPEIITAKQKNITILHRSDVLAQLMKDKQSIAISGSHGKTTTTSMISHILIESKIDPTIIIGGHLKSINDNAKYGSSNILVAEADESDKSIEKLFPTWAIVTNIDLEHLETYKDLDEIKNTFSIFLNKIPPAGKAIICIDDKTIASMSFESMSTITYAIDKSADFMAKNIQLELDHSIFDVYKQNENLGTIKLNIAGKHNILNALASIAQCLEIGVTFEQISQAFKTFNGVERRFSYNGDFNGAQIFDDYGHHPVEIMNTIAVAKKRSKNKLIVVFQPHRYTRTQKLWNDFIDVLSNAQIDNLIITDIYPASESPIDNITSQNLVKQIKEKFPTQNISYIAYENDFKQIIDEIKSKVTKDDLLLLLGAGKINKIADNLI